MPRHWNRSFPRVVLIAVLLRVEPVWLALSEYSSTELGWLLYRFACELFTAEIVKRQGLPVADGYATLCARVTGVYCTHCQHQSVEELCPNQCQNCISGGSPSPVAPSPSFSVDGKSLERLRSQCPLLTGGSCAACLNLDVAQICINDCGLCAGRGQIPFPGFPGYNEGLIGAPPPNLAISLTNDGDANSVVNPNRLVVSGGIRHGQNLVDLLPSGVLSPAEFYYSHDGGAGRYESGGEFDVDGEVIDEFYGGVPGGSDGGLTQDQYRLVDLGETR